LAQAQVTDHLSIATRKQLAAGSQHGDRIHLRRLMMPFSDAESTLQQESSEILHGTHRHLSGRWVKYGKFSAVVFVFIAAGALFATHGSPKRFPVVDVLGLEQLNSNDPCAAYAFLDLVKVVYNNLGNKGPDKGPEGLVYEANALTPNGATSRPLYITVNCTNLDDYTPYAVNEVGLGGKFGSFNIKEGTKVHLVFKVYDKATWAPFSIDSQQFSFFDLDTHMGEVVEYVKLKGLSSYTVSKTTEIDISKDDNGFYTFTATKEGTGADNPADPTQLNDMQRNRAVTVDFKNFDGFEAEFGASAGPLSPRWFKWVGRPSLLCAQNPNGILDPQNPGGGSDVNTVTVEEERNCWFIVPIFNWCFPKFW